jgi:hypothetical protein
MLNITNNIFPLIRPVIIMYLNKGFIIKKGLIIYNFQHFEQIIADEIDDSSYLFNVKIISETNYEKYKYL